MFRSEDKQFVASKTVSVFPEVQSDFKPANNNVVRWFIPSSIGFFDPRHTKMKYDLTMSGRGINRPDPRAGVHSLWRDMRVRDGTGITELEYIQDYNVLTSQWWKYTSNQSIDDTRDMFQGRSANQAINQQLFYGPTPSWTSAKQTTSPEKLTIEINQPIYSGVLGGDKIFPVAATKGLRCEMYLDTLQRSLTQNTDNGEEPLYLTTKIQKLNTADSKTAIGDEFTISVEQPSVSATGRGVFRNESPVNNNPFDIGDPLYISQAADGADETLLGVITAFDKDGDNDLLISYIPDRANGVAIGTTFNVGSRLFYKIGDRINGKTVTQVPAAQIASAALKIDYTISDIQMLMLQVQPPTQYVEAMMKQIMGPGLTLDYRTSQLYRFNLATLNGLTSQLIPATQDKAYSVLSVPLSQAQQNDITTSAFRGRIDGQLDYQYVYGSQLIPDRPVELVRLTQTPPRAEMLALMELEKALVNADKPVRNLLRPADTFLIGRAFSKYGQVSDIATDSLSLRVNYSGATVQKMFEHFVMYLKRIKISSDGVMVI